MDWLAGWVVVEPTQRHTLPVSGSLDEQAAVSVATATSMAARTASLRMRSPLLSCAASTPAVPGE